MTTMEIVLLVIGLIAFVISFLIPDKVSESEGESLTRDEIRNIVYDEYENTKTRLEDITEETVTYSVEKAERALDRITNEKMLALGEYSDSIMSQISTNHQETVFLHDMLNNNKNDLTVLLGQAVKDSKEASEAAREAASISNKALDESKKAIDNATNAKESAVVAEDKMIAARKAIEGGNEPVEAPPVKKKTTRKRTTSKSKTSKNAVPVDDNDNIIIENDGQISLRFDVDEEPKANNNAKVLKLHKQGKSNVAIAKELGLGVGEVKLVIDLFDKK